MGRLQKLWEFEQAICRAVEVGIAHEVSKLGIRYGDLRVRHQPWIKKSNSLANGKKITSVESTGDAFPPKHLQDSAVTMHFSCQVIEMVKCAFTDMQQNQQPLNFSMSQIDGWPRTLQAQSRLEQHTSFCWAASGTRRSQ